MRSRSQLKNEIKGMRYNLAELGTICINFIQSGWVPSLFPGTFINMFGLFRLI